MLGKKKSPKRKISLSSSFHRKKSWKLRCKFKYGFTMVICKKRKTKQNKTKKVFFDFKQKMYSETLNAYFYYSSEMFKKKKIIIII